MPRGGKRAGAGRPKGTAHKKTREVADKAAAEGITPLEVMLDVMRRLYKDKDYTAAASIAHDAAPYMHPRLGQISHTVEASHTLEIVEVIVDGHRPSQNGTAPQSAS